MSECFRGGEKFADHVQGTLEEVCRSAVSASSNSKDTNPAAVTSTDCRLRALDCVDNMGAQEQEPTEGMLPHRNANKQAEIGVFALSPAPPPGANQWTGSLFGCCTDCDSDAQSSCVLSYFVPCVAFGCVHVRFTRDSHGTCQNNPGRPWSVAKKSCLLCRLNMKRALNLWAWCQAVIFLVLFLVVRWFYLWSYTSVMLYCSPSSPVGVRHTADLAQHQYQYASTAGKKQHKMACILWRLRALSIAAL